MKGQARLKDIPLMTGRKIFLSLGKFFSYPSPKGLLLPVQVDSLTGTILALSSEEVKFLSIKTAEAAGEVQ